MSSRNTHATHAYMRSCCMLVIVSLMVTVLAVAGGESLSSVAQVHSLASAGARTIAIQQPHWSTLRTHEHFMRIPMERKGFIDQSSAADGATSTTMHSMTDVVRPPRPARSSIYKEKFPSKSRGFHTEATTDTTNGSPLSGCAQLDFTIPIQFGSTTTGYDLLMDTGSSTLAVAGKTCSSCTSAGVTKLYQNTGTKTAGTASGQYADGSGWTGEIYTETVTVKGATSSASGSVPPAVSMNIVSMSTQTQQFFSKSACFTNTASSSHTQGIIGFAYQSIAEDGTDSFWEKFFAANPSVTKSFYVEMCLKDGAVWFSGMSLANYGGQFMYVPIAAKDYFTVAVSSFAVGGTTVGGTVASDVQSIVDSGTTMWTMPFTQYNAVVQAIGTNTKFKQYFSAGTAFFSDGECYPLPTGVTLATLNANLPTLAVTFGNGVKIELKALGSYLLPCDSALTKFSSGIDGSSDDPKTQIMGWSFMNALVIHHDTSSSSGFSNGRLGFAVQYGCAPKIGGGSSSEAVITGSTASGPTGTAGATYGFTVTGTPSQMYTSTASQTRSISLTVTPNPAPTVDVTLSVTCTQGSYTNTNSVTFTAATSSAKSLTITASSTTGSMVCSFTPSGTNGALYAAPATFTVTLLAYNQLSMTAPSQVCSGSVFAVTVSTIDLTGSLAVDVTQQGSTDFYTATLAQATASGTANVIVQTVGLNTLGLKLSSAGGADSARFDYTLSTVQVNIRNCTIDPIPVSSSTGSAGGGGGEIVNDAVYVSFSFTSVTSDVFDSTNPSAFIEELQAELAEALTIDASAITNIQLVYGSDGKTLNSVNFLIVAPASTTPALLKSKLQSQLDSSSSTFRGLQIGSIVDKAQMVECNQAETCADAGDVNSKDNTVLFGLALWLILIIFIGGGLCICIGLCCLVKGCTKSNAAGSAKRPRPQSPQANGTGGNGTVGFDSVGQPQSPNYAYQAHQSPPATGYTAGGYPGAVQQRGAGASIAPNPGNGYPGAVNNYYPGAVQQQSHAGRNNAFTNQTPVAIHPGATEMQSYGRSTTPAQAYAGQAYEPPHPAPVAPYPTQPAGEYPGATAGAAAPYTAVDYGRPVGAAAPANKFRIVYAQGENTRPMRTPSTRQV